MITFYTDNQASVHVVRGGAVRFIAVISYTTGSVNVRHAVY